MIGPYQASIGTHVCMSAQETYEHSIEQVARISCPLGGVLALLLCLFRQPCSVCRLLTNNSYNNNFLQHFHNELLY